MAAKWNEKKLGFGLMRLPQKDGEVDLEASYPIVDRFIEAGYTYFDTAYVYKGSEVAFRKLISERYPRDKYTVATKMAGWLLNDTYTAQDMFNEELERTGVDYFDFYLLHSVQPTHVAPFDDNGCWDFCRKMKEEGKIKNFGFSFHGTPELLDKTLTDHPEVDFVQLQINYVDWDNTLLWSGANYEVAVKHGKDIVVMEPNKGGFLSSLSPELETKYRALDPEATPTSYAMRFVGSLPNIKVILSGMNSVAQVEDNIRTFDDFKPVTEEEKTVIEEVKNALLSLPTVPCTACRYCTAGCPMSINIPEIFKAYNLMLLFGEHARPHIHYRQMREMGSGRASECITCGQCESVCPQHIDIIEKLKAASALLDVQ